MDRFDVPIIADGSHDRRGSPGGARAPLSRNVLTSVTLAGIIAMVAGTVLASDAPREESLAIVPEVPTLAAGSVNDAGSLPTSATAQVAPVAHVDTVNPGTSITRSLCLTIAAGQGVAYECADTRAVVPLPAARTYNQGRAPALVYNSDHAAPRPVVYVDITLPSNASVPTTMRATLSIPGKPTIVKEWPGSSWTAGARRRVGIQWDAFDWETHVYPYTVEVSAIYSGHQVQSVPESGQLVIVNRKTSPFGAGWWPAGLEQLVCINCGSSDYQMLWVGGDGSTRLFQTDVPAQRWIATNPAGGPDTLTLSYPIFTRRLKGGGIVQYDGGGRHTRTVNRLGRETRFLRDGQLRLQTILAPVPGTDTVSWHFNYTAQGTVQNVVTRVGSVLRTTSLGVTSGRLQQVTDPDGRSISFGYNATNNRLTSRTDRRGTVTTFAYAASGKLSSSTVQMQGTGANIVTAFASAENKAITSVLAPSSLFTRLNGPRTDENDHTDFWIDRFGSPTRIRDAYLNNTYIYRSQARPAQVIRTVAPNGLVSRAWYNARGGLDSTRVESPLGVAGQHAVTRYTYHPTCIDYLYSVTAPTGEVTYTGYDVAIAPGLQTPTCNRIWQQVGSDPARRVNFGYYGAGSLYGMMQSVQEAEASSATVLAYDAVLGNLNAVQTPTQHSAFHNDAIGRDSASASQIQGPLYHWNYTYYEANSDRVWRTVSQAPAMNGVASQSVVVTTASDEEGLPLSVTREAVPDETSSGMVITEWKYDRAGRRVRETSAFQRDSTVYDPAGNVVWQRDRRGLVTTLRYDRMNRMVERIAPSITYPKATCVITWSIDCAQRRFPFYATAGDSLVIPGDTALFEYDISGNLLRANNREARTRRTYYPNGLVETDSQWIRNYAAYDNGAPPPGSGGGGNHPPPCEAGGICIESTGGGAGSLNGVPTQTPRGRGQGRGGGGGGGGGGSGELTTMSIPGDPYPNAEFNQFVYGLEYTYDLSGRRLSLRYPTNLIPSTSSGGRMYYGYHAVTGAIQTLTDVYGRHYTYGYDNRGRPTSFAFPGGGMETRTFDDDGRMTFRNETTGYGTVGLHQYTFSHDARGKILSAVGGTSSGWQSHSTDYSGIGQVAATDWTQHGSAGTIEESFQMDALENVRQHYEKDVLGAERVTDYDYLPSTHRLSEVRKHRLGINVIPVEADTLRQTYDLAGNVRFTQQRRYATDYSGFWQQIGWTETASFFGGDNRLHVYNRYSWAGGNVKDGLVEEYRYDALGRRIVSRVRRGDGLCSGQDCIDATTRFIWDGDQLVYELRAEAPTVAWSSGRYHGKVFYTHGPGIDAPVGIYREQYQASAPFLIVPHTNWRGRYDSGTYPFGGGGIYIRWPGEQDRAFMSVQPSTSSPSDWAGSLIDEHKDASGLMYRRNRYYDPQTGRFTQEDPIGIAGGLNVYGFAAGDPISYSDPYGLNPCRTLGLAGRLAVAGVASLADGPLPFGEILAAACLAAGVTALAGGTILLADEAADRANERSRPRRRPVDQIRKEWEELNDQEWPQGENGENLQADHDTPLADGGEDHGRNVTPRTRRDHIQRHIDNNDFSRWGKRAHPPTRPQSGPSPD